MKEFRALLRQLTFGKAEDRFVFFSAVMIFVLMMLTIVDVTGRYLFRRPLQGSVEISELLLIVIIALAIAGTQRLGGHIGMDALLDKFKKMKRPVYPAFQTFGLFVSEVAFVIALYYCFLALLQALDINQTTSGPLYAIVWPVKCLLLFGLLLMCVRLAIQLIEAIRNIRTWGK